MIKKYYLKDYSRIKNFISDDNFQEDYDILLLALNKIQNLIYDGEINIVLSDSLYKKDKQILFTEYNLDLFTQGIVGVFKTSVFYMEQEIKVWVSITSRFDIDESKPYFLAKMFELYDQELSNVLTEITEDELFDFLLVYIFNNRFINSIQNGYYREYVTYKEESNKLKGRIDFAELIKKMGLKSATLPIVYSERSVDNRLNRLAYKAYSILKNKYPKLVELLIDSTETKKYIEYLKDETTEKDIHTILKESIRPITHPLLINYEELRIISLKILNDDKISPFDVEHEETESALFYIPDLWEKYLENNFFENIKDERTNVLSQNRLRVVDALTIRPDFVIYKNESPIFVLDAKFKPDWSEGRFNPDDYTKSIRDMNAFNCSMTGVIFPSLNIEDEIIKTNIISEFNQQDSFSRIAINIPDVIEKTYNEFSVEMDNNLESSIRMFSYFLDNDNN